jgi:hypothetical protein
MQLSETEKKMVARLRKQEASLLRWRWFLLAVGVFDLAVVAYYSSLLVRWLQQPDSVHLDSTPRMLVFGSSWIK